MSTESYLKFRKLVEKRGIWFASHVWKEPLDIEGVKTFRWCIVDGTGRKRLFQKMASDGYEIPDIPCVEIFAESLKEAKEAVIAGTSKFHVTTKDGLHEFLESGSFDVSILDEYSIDEIDTAEFKIEFYDDLLGTPVIDPANKDHVSFDAYQNASVKQVVLYYPKEEYEKVIEMFDKLLIKLSADDHSQVVWRLLSEASRS